MLNLVVPKVTIRL